MTRTRPQARTRCLATAIAPIALAAAVLGFRPAVAAGPDAASGTAAAWTIDDLLLAESISQPALSRDGAVAAWVKTTIEKVDGEEKRVSNLWLTRLADGTSLQLTRGRDTASAPAFSPDGRHLAFLSTRKAPGGKDDDGKPQVWAIAVAGGEAFPVTKLDRSVRSFGWIDDRTLVVAAQETPTAWERERKEAKDDATVVDDAEHEPPVRLFRVPLAAGKAVRLTANTDWIDQLAVAPDGSRAVVTAQQSLSYDFDQRVPPQAFLVDLASGARTRLFADGVLRPDDVRWAPDGTAFYFVNSYSSHPRYRQATVHELWRHDVAAGTTEKVDLAWPRGLGGGYCPLPGNGVAALLADGVRLRPVVATCGAAGWTRTDLTGTHASHLGSLEAAAVGDAIVYRTSTATTPTQWYAARLAAGRISSEKRLADLNAAYAGKPTGRVETVRWKGARGDEVEGLLHYPLDWKDGERRPLVLAIHGGPAGVDRDEWGERWASPLVLWRQRGAFVLQVNYHGSSGYGLAWVESIAGRYYELEVPDIELGVDELIRRRLVDPERLATTGWSNGGILSAALITTTTRYKAASIGAADVEWYSDWANVDFGAAFDNYYFGGPPWEKVDVYRDKSPFFKLPAVTTPTIAFTGTEDRNVPPHQSWSLFRALQQIGRAPVKLVLFPGEPHSLRKVVHQRRKLEEELAFFDRHLFATGAKPYDAVKTGSPLQTLLSRAKAAKAGTAFGQREGGVLVPETVRFAGLEVGRFEVTNAQFAAFDAAFAVPAGRENDPAVGVPFVRAKAYAAWLAAKTGKPFRLPGVAEAEKLASIAGTGGNTLDRWAGYPPNPDDRARLQVALAPLGLGVLLLPVGSVSGCGDDPVFDLDGNAAEWAVGPDGAGVATGPSADQPAEPLGARAPAPEVTGLRVVVAAATP